MDAFGKNVSDSPFPPTRADIAFVMKQLLEQGIPNAQVQTRFEVHYEPSYVRKLLKDAHGNLAKARMQKAVSAVAHGGISVDEAAKENKVKPDTLREEITGVKRRRHSTDITEIKKDISNRHRGNSQRTIHLFRDLLDKYESGELSEKKVLEVLLHVKHLNTDAAKRVDSWLERFETLKGTIKAKF